MASYLPFHPPPAPPSTFPPAQPPPPNQNPPPPPPAPAAHGGNQHSQNWGPYGSSEAPSYSQNYPQGNPASNYHQQHFSLPPRNPFPPQTHQQPFQYQPARPPPPPDASYPPPPPPPIASSTAPAYYSVSQYPNFGHPPPPSSPLPPPPPSQPSPPPPPVPSQPTSSVNKDSKPDPGAYAKKDIKPPLPTSGKKSGGDVTDRVETEDERRARKRREYEKQKQDEKMKLHLKELQNKALQKTQVVSSGVKGHGPVSGSHMGDRRSAPLLSGDRAENRLKKPTTFLCKMKFRNELPDPSAKMKLLTLKQDPDRYCKYQITSLEKNWKPQLHVEPDLGIPLDLLDLSVYIPPKGERIQLDPRDEELLRDNDQVTPVKADGIRIKERPTDKGVSWLVKTQYISPLSMESTKQSLTEKQAKELKESRDRDLLENLNNREKQIKNITASFEACRSKPVHATNPQLHPKRILPLFPDFDRQALLGWDDQFVIATFDSAPTLDSEIYGRLTPEEREEFEQRAIMKSYTSSSSNGEKPDKFLAYMVPSTNELEKDMYDENEDISYSWVREYHWDVRGDDVEDPTTYLVTFGETEAKYLPLPTKLILRKKRAREGKQREETEQIRVPSSITVRRRPTVAAMELREEDYGPSSKSGNMSSRSRRDGVDRGRSRLRRVVEDTDGDNFSGAEDYHRSSYFALYSRGRDSLPVSPD